MKLYIINVYGPDTYEGDDTLLGVFDSKEKYLEALQNYEDEMGFEITEDNYSVREVTLNESDF